MRLIDLLDIKCRSISSMSIWKLTNLVCKDSELLEAILGEESDDSDFEVECIESLLPLFNRAISFGTNFTMAAETKWEDRISHRINQLRRSLLFVNPYFVR